MRGSVQKLIVLACALASVLGAAATAAAANGPVPWEGGVEVVGEFESRSSAALSELAQRQVWAVCANPDEWNQIASVQKFDPDDVWGITPFDAATMVPLDFTVVSPQACLAASEWVYAKDRRAQKWCVTGSKTEYRSESVTRYRTKYRTVVKITKVKGVRRSVRVRIAVRVKYRTTRRVGRSVPVEEVCNDYLAKLFGWQTLIHEGVHLTGQSNEAVTECHALQHLPWFAAKMGIDAAQAREIGVDYWTLFYVPYRPQVPDYFSPECRDGAALDLRPDSSDWPLLRMGPRRDLAAEVAPLFNGPVPHHETRR